MNNHAAELDMVTAKIPRTRHDFDRQLQGTFVRRLSHPRHHHGPSAQRRHVAVTPRLGSCHSLWRTCGRGART